VKILGREVDPFDLFLILVLLLAASGFFTSGNGDDDPKRKEEDEERPPTFLEFLRGHAGKRSRARRWVFSKRFLLKRPKVLPMRFKS